MKALAKRTESAHNACYSSNSVSCCP